MEINTRIFEAYSGAELGSGHLYGPLFVGSVMITLHPLLC